MNGEETRFKKGDKAAEKWTKEEAEKVFIDMLNFTIENDDVVSVQQAYIDFKMPSTTYYYLQEKFPNLVSIKKGINDVIISRVNKGAINNEMNSTACIWRMKQLGETDKQDIDHTSKGESMSLTPMQFVKTNDKDKR